MPEIIEMLADILNHSPAESGEIRHNSPPFRHSKTGMDSAFSPLSPLSPAQPCKSDSPRANDDRERDLEAIRTWLIQTGRPPEDYLFKLIVEKCQNDDAAREHFLKYSRRGQVNLVPVPDIPSRPNTGESVDDIERIRNWLISIGEPEEEQHLVLDKCRNDPEALAYFLKHANN